MIALWAGLLGLSLAAMAAYQIAGSTGRGVWTVIAGLFGGAAGSGGVLVLYVVLRSYQRLHDTESELRALVNVRPLTGRLPLDLGGWAADPVLADRAVRLLLQRRPRRVVECGSGWSTVIMASCLRELGGGKLVALEHQDEFAHRTRELLLRYGVFDWAEVVHAPLEEVRIDDGTWPWYGIDPADVVDGPVDVLVVDGPPGSLAQRSRYPAVPLFVGQLADSWAVLLDDGHREDEAWIAEQWSRQLGVEPRLDTAGRGVFVLTSPLRGESAEDVPADGPAA